MRRSWTCVPVSDHTYCPLFHGERFCGSLPTLSDFRQGTAFVDVLLRSVWALYVPGTIVERACPVLERWLIRLWMPWMASKLVVHDRLRLWDNCSTMVTESAQIPSVCHDFVQDVIR